MEDLGELGKKIQSLTTEERLEYFKKLTEKELDFLFMHPSLFLMPKQIPPTTPWRYHMYRGGRGTGKSFASTSWLADKIMNGAQEVAIVGATYQDLVKDILPVFESHFPARIRPHFQTKNNIYECFNGCTVKVYSSDTEIRGMNAEFAIAEEICKWNEGNPEKIQERFDVFDLGVRSKRAKPCPQIFIASTPKPFKFFIDFEREFLAGNPDYSMVVSNTAENVHLSEHAKRAFYKKYDGTRLGLQELNGDLLTDNPNALFTEEMIQRVKMSQQEFDHLIETGILTVIKSAVAVDPAVSTNLYSDETGIIVGSLCSDNKVYIREDCSGKLTPEQWAGKACELYNRYNCSHVIMESNQGGNLLEQAIKTVDRYVRTQLVHASVGKVTRFEPVVMAYERKEVFHVGNLFGLEQQMMAFNPYLKHQDSPDRADSAAYLVYYLLLGQKAPSRRTAKNFASW